MEIYSEIIELNTPASIALGFFDGLHRGHMEVIRHAALCRKEGLTPVVFTFSQNPQTVLSGNTADRLISDENKAELLQRAGVEVLYAVDFTRIKDLSPQDFLEKILIQKLRAQKLFCGFNFHFGTGGRADAHSLEMMCRGYNIPVNTIEPVRYGGQPVSSTRIRLALKSGDVQGANAMLGRNFSFDFPVRRGNQLGRKMLTPTFNQPFPDGFILPKFGVYATAVRIGGTWRCGVTNIGVKPTVGSSCPLAETWMPDFDCGDLYDRKIKVSLLRFLRSEKKFAGIKQLQAAIIADGAAAQEIFKEYNSIT